MGGGYTAEWKIWHLSQQQITRWSRSKSGSSSYKYNGKQAEAENNKQRRVLWSTSAGRRDCCRSMLCISPLNSSMTALCLAHGHNRRKKGWQQDMLFRAAALFRCLLCCVRARCLWKERRPGLSSKTCFAVLCICLSQGKNKDIQSWKCANISNVAT